VLDSSGDGLQAGVRVAHVEGPQGRAHVPEHEVEVMVGSVPGPALLIVFPHDAGVLLGPQGPGDSGHHHVALLGREAGPRIDRQVVERDLGLRPVPQQFHGP
jgi:hypothetical protein